MISNETVDTVDTIVTEVTNINHLSTTKQYQPQKPKYYTPRWQTVNYVNQLVTT